MGEHREPQGRLDKFPNGVLWRSPGGGGRLRQKPAIQTNASRRSRLPHPHPTRQSNCSILFSTNPKTHLGRRRVDRCPWVHSFPLVATPLRPPLCPESYTVYVSQPPPPSFYDIFPKRLGIFCPKFTRLLRVPVYAVTNFYLIICNVDEVMPY